MPDAIRVLVVDDSESTVDAVSLMLRLEKGFTVVGTAADGQAAIERVGELKPDVVLMDVLMPVLDGITATERIITGHPGTAVVMLSGQTDNEYLRRAMHVGASYYLAKPVASDELYNSIRRAHEVVALRRRHFAPAAPAPVAAPPTPQGRVIAFFSPTGGVGRTTISTNTAAALAMAGRRVALADLSLPFGDVGVLLNVPPRGPSVADLVGKFDGLESSDLDRVLYRHRTGLRALVGPPTPEVEERIVADDVRRLLALLRSSYELVFVDTWPSYGETMLAVLDVADTIVVPFTPTLTSVKNARVFIEVMTKLDMERKIALVLNRSDEPGGLRAGDLESGLGRKVLLSLPSDEHTLRLAMNRGYPLVEASPSSKLTKAFATLANALVADAARKAA